MKDNCLRKRSNWSRMSGFSLAVNRASGRALVIGSAACRASVVTVLDRLGYQATELDDPYEAMAEVCQRPLAYRAVILSLASVYREELQIITAVKGRYSHIEIWLSHVDGRAAALAEASRLGADGLLAEDGLHRFATTSEEAAAKVAVGAVAGARPAAKTTVAQGGQPGLGQPAKPDRMDGPLVDVPVGEPVLTAEELRALLQEPPLGHADGQEP
jgi:hypothetical protein